MATERKLNRPWWLRRSIRYPTYNFCHRYRHTVVCLFLKKRDNRDWSYQEEESGEPALVGGVDANLLTPVVWGRDLRVFLAREMQRGLNLRGPQSSAGSVERASRPHPITPIMPILWHGATLDARAGHTVLVFHLFPSLLFFTGRIRTTRRWGWAASASGRRHRPLLTCRKCPRTRSGSAHSMATARRAPWPATGHASTFSVDRNVPFYQYKVIAPLLVNTDKR